MRLILRVLEVAPHPDPLPASGEGKWSAIRGTASMTIQRFLDSLAFPRARIVAFEAHPESATVVRQTVSEFPNIEVVEAAVCDTDGEIAFHAAVEGNPGASSLFVASGHNDVAPIRQAAITARAIRSDTWARQAGIDRFDLV